MAYQGGGSEGREGERTVDAALPEILAALRGLRFGSVEIVVHDGRVVQVERREKVRLAR